METLYLNLILTCPYPWSPTSTPTPTPTAAHFDAMLGTVKVKDRSASGQANTTFRVGRLGLGCLQGVGVRAGVRAWGTDKGRVRGAVTKYI